MKNRLTAIIAPLLAVSLGATAFAQTTPQVPPQQQTPPEQQMPPQQQMPPATSANPASGAQTGQGDGASSSTVEHKIKRALTRHGVTATGVTVAFSNGTATLSGTVYTQKDIAKAKQAAMKVSGVTQVDVSGLHARKGQGKPSSGQS